MRVIFCGDRNWADANFIGKVMDDIIGLIAADTSLAILHDKFHSTETIKLVVIEGEAPGADTLSRLEANKRHLTVVPFPANWAQFHRAAGPIRNGQMLKEGKPDGVFAFHDDIKNSKGTLDMIRQSLAYKRINSHLVIKLHSHSGVEIIENINQMR